MTASFCRETDPLEAFDMSATAMVFSGADLMRGWWYVWPNKDGSYWIYLHPNAGLMYQQPGLKLRPRCAREDFGASLAPLMEQAVRTYSLDRDALRIMLIRQRVGGPPILIINPSTEIFEATRGEYPSREFVELLEMPFGVDELEALGRRADALRFRR